MQRSKWIWLIIGLIIIGGVGYGIVHRTHVTATADTATTQSTTISYHGEDGKTALTLLKTHASVETTADPNLGEYVTTINGVKGGTNGKYWIFYLNGQAASMGANTYVTTASDTIEWKLE